MNRQIFAALMATVTSTPWAMRRETLEAAQLAIAGGALNSIPAASLEAIASGAALTEPVSIGPDAAISKPRERALAKLPGGVAVIRAHGIISPRVTLLDMLLGGGVTPPSWLAARARDAVEDETVKAVVIDWDSPGGSVLGVHEAAAAIFALRGSKPIVSQASGVLASAAYWMAASADEIVAADSAIVGSIGVYTMHADASKLYEELGVKFTFVEAGKNKTETDDSKPLSDEARAHLQEVVDDYMGQFAGDVARGRGVTPAVVRGEDYGQGRAYVGARAVKRGLADKARDLPGTLAALGVGGVPEARGRRSVALLTRDLHALTL